MTKTLTRIFGAAAGLIALVAIVWVWTSFSGAEQTATKSARFENTARSGSEIVDGYKKWTHVNPVPEVLPSRIAFLCAPVPQQIRMEEGNPHLDKFITVYVNEIGRHAMMEEKLPRFPQGSVIVKEKLAAKDSSPPELLTVMIKREAGYNPENGDWEYMVLDGPGKSVQARGKLEHCQSCHMSVKHTDYVSRRYLPNEVWQKLK